MREDARCRGGGGRASRKHPADAVWKATQSRPRPRPTFRGLLPAHLGDVGAQLRAAHGRPGGAPCCHFALGDPKRHAVCALAGTRAPVSPRHDTGASWGSIGSPHPILGTLGCVQFLPFQAASAGAYMQTPPCTFRVPSPLGLPVPGGRQRPGTVQVGAGTEACPAPRGRLPEGGWDFASQRLSGWASEEKAQHAARTFGPVRAWSFWNADRVVSKANRQKVAELAKKVQPRGKRAVPEGPHASPGGDWEVGWISYVGEAGLRTGGPPRLGQLLGDLWPCPPALRGRAPGAGAAGLTPGDAERQGHVRELQAVLRRLQLGQQRHQLVA